jgi:lipoprotein NlpI
MAVARFPDRHAAFAAAVPLLAACLAAGLLNGAHAIEPGSDLAKQLQADRRLRMEHVIARSSQQIESPQIEGAALATAFRSRGVARGYLLQHAEALEDLNRAVELDPFNAQNYEDRARTYLKLREFKAAGEDLDMALGLDSKRWSAQRDKGRVAAYQSAFLDATFEFRRAWRLSDTDSSMYNAIWLDIVSRRAGLEETLLLDDWLAQIDPKRWPAPVMAMLRGTVSPEQSIAAAAAVDPRTALGQQCEAYFYAGQLHLIRGEAEQARAAFASAVATGAIEYLEYDWAMRELELMGPPPRYP